MIIQHNIPGINATRNKGIAEGKLKKNLEKLSSGYRINRAGDDAAGLAISESMRSQIRGLNQAMKNCDDGIGLTSTGDGALMEVHSMLERMKTLAIQSANSTYTTAARENLDFERQELLDEIDRIGETTDFADIPLFDKVETDPATGKPVTDKTRGGAPFVPPEKSEKDPDITMQIGHSKYETLDVPRYYMSSSALLLNRTDFTTQKGANDSVEWIDKAIEAVSDIRADFGAAQNHMEHTFKNLDVTSENMTAAESRIRDTQMADVFTQYTKENIFYQASNSMAAQANATIESAISLLQ